VRRGRGPSEESIAAVLFVLFLVVAVIVTVWIHFFAPCHAIGWLPAKDLPSRCFSFTRQ
jgi:hypothetical protein